MAGDQPTQDIGENLHFGPKWGISKMPKVKMSRFGKTRSSCSQKSLENIRTYGQKSGWSATGQPKTLENLTFWTEIQDLQNAYSQNQQILKDPDQPRPEKSRKHEDIWPEIGMVGDFDPDVLETSGFYNHKQDLKIEKMRALPPSQHEQHFWNLMQMQAEGVSAMSV